MKQTRLPGELRWCIFFSLLFCSSASSLDPLFSSGSVITHLPGFQGPLPFHLETGCVSSFLAVSFHNLLHVCMNASVLPRRSGVYICASGTWRWTKAMAFASSTTSSTPSAARPTTLSCCGSQAAPGAPSSPPSHTRSVCTMDATTSNPSKYSSFSSLFSP